MKDNQTLFYNYLWNGGPDKIKRSIIIQNYDRGGLRMMDADSCINSLKLAWLRRMLFTPNKYFTTTSRRYPILYDCIKFGSQYLTERKLRNIIFFWSDILSSFIDMVKPKNMNEIMSISLSCNKTIKVGSNTVFYKTWSDNGIICLGDIFSMNDQILSYEAFRLKYNFQTIFLEFYGLINSVRQYINRFNFQEILGMPATRVQQLAISCILRNKKGCNKAFCKVFVENKMPHIPFPTLGRDMNLDDNFNWKTILSLPFNIKQDTNLMVSV